jgi:hypothetical protein
MNKTWSTEIEASGNYQLPITEINQLRNNRVYWVS